MNKLSKYGYWIAPILLMVGFAVLLGFNGLYGQDSHEYLRFATDWKASGLDPALVSDFQWPIGFPLLGILLSYLGIPLMWSMNIVSLLAALGVLIYTNKIIVLIYGKSGRLWLLLAAATQVYFIRGGILVMSDMLSCLFVVLGYYHLFRYRENKRLASLLYLLLAATFAFFSRYASVPLLVPPVIYGFYLLFKNAGKAVKIGAALSLVTVTIIFVWLNNRLLSLSSELFTQWNINNVFSRSIEAQDGTFYRTVPNIMYIFGNFFHIGYLALGVLLIPFYKYSSEALRERVLLIGLVFYFFTLVGLETQNYRFLILSHPLVLILLFGAFDRFYGMLSLKRLSGVFVIGVLLFNAAFFFYSFRKTFAVHATEKEVTTALKELKHDGVIYTFYVDQSFPSYGINNEVKNLYMESYTEFESGALVVYNPVNFAKQWKGSKVDLNWKFLISNYELDTLVYLNDNWRIYEIR